MMELNWSPMSACDRRTSACCTCGRRIVWRSSSSVLSRSGSSGSSASLTLASSNSASTSSPRSTSFSGTVDCRCIAPARPIIACMKADADMAPPLPVPASVPALAAAPSVPAVAVPVAPAAPSAPVALAALAAPPIMLCRMEDTSCTSIPAPAPAPAAAAPLAPALPAASAPASPPSLTLAVGSRSSWFNLPTNSASLDASGSCIQ
mmetsp:Transcript_22534/g.72533  ORF Transcript_22534/g.72533 Transcript_22534/m.72533 type:complete len:206 (-) Transcript_22534:392-1009(-)